MSLLSVLLIAAFVGVPERPPIVSFTNAEVRHKKVDHGYIYPATPASVTMVADVTVLSLPTKPGATIFGRRGWHNRLCLNPDGQLDWACFAWDGKQSANVKSKTRLVAGRTYRLAGVLDCSHGDETRMRLYVDGCEDGEPKTLKGAPWNYPWAVEIGQIGWRADGNHQDPSDCLFRNFWYYYKPLTADEIKALPPVAGNRRADAFELRTDRGVPRIFRNGQVMPSRVFFGSFMHGGFPKSWEAVPRQFSYALDAGVPFFETHGDLFWDGCDEAKVAAFNRKRAQAFFAEAKGRPCWMIVRLLCNPPTWWMDAHPETSSGWNDRSKLTGWIARHPMQTLASSVYQEAAVKALQKTIAFYEREFPGRMAGYHLAGLHTSEWDYDGLYTRETEGHDEPTRQGFRAYLAKKYGSVAADADVPSHAQRVGDGVKFLREPADAADARLIDFNAYRTRLVSDTIRRFARTARAACPGRLIGVFYGYITQGSWYGGGGRSGYLSLREVLDSPDVDFCCSPFNYNWRRVDQPLATQGVLHSIARAGKIWLNEDDTATYLACRTNDGGPSMHSKCPTPGETADMLRRNLTFTYLNNQAIWWMDLNGAGWFDDPAIWKTMKEFAPLERDLLAHPVAAEPEFALAFDHRGALHFEGEHAKESAPPNWSENMVGEFSSLGAPLGVYLSDDILGGRAPAVRAAIFPTSYAADGATRRRMQDWAKTHGTIWVWAPGYIDLDTGRASLASVRETTGFAVRELASSVEPKVVATETGRHYGLPERFGPFERFGAPKLDTYKPVLSPVPGEGDVVLANYLSGEPAVVLRKGPSGAPQVFCGTYQVPRELVRAVALASGVHFSAPMGTAVYTNGRDVGVYAMKDGAVVVTPKKSGTYADYFTGRTFSGSSFTLPMRKGETILLRPNATTP